MGRKKNDDAALDEGPRSFARCLEMVADGQLHSDASEALHELAQALAAEADERHSDAKGTLTLTLKLTVEPSGIVGIGYDIVTKEPKPSRPKGVLWLTPGGNLTPHNPRQQSLPLRALDTDDAPRSVPSDNTKAREV